MTAALLALAAATGCAQSSSSEASDTQTQAQQQLQEQGRGDAGDGRRRVPHKPPAEAFDACTGKAAGDACSVKHRDDTLTGKCVTPPEGAPDTRIVCLPDRFPEHGRGPHGPPPAEVFAACDGQAADATCSVTLGGQTLDGTCKAPPPSVGDGRLGCLPARPPHPEDR